MNSLSVGLKRGSAYEAPIPDPPLGTLTKELDKQCVQPGGRFLYHRRVSVMRDDCPYC